MAGTVLWMAGLVLAVGAVVLQLAGPVWAAAAVGGVMFLEGLAADLLDGGPLPRRGDDENEGIV